VQLPTKAGLNNLQTGELLSIYTDLYSHCVNVKMYAGLTTPHGVTFT